MSEKIIKITNKDIDLITQNIKDGKISCLTDPDKLKNIRGIIFDMDGVISDTETMSLDFWKKTLKKYGYDMPDQIYINLMGQTRDLISKGMAEYFGDGVPIDQIYEEKTTTMVNHLNSIILPLKPGVKEILEYFKEKGYKTAVATSTSSVNALRRLKSADLMKYLDFVICGDQVKKSKPNPEIFIKACENLGLKASECLVIEDASAGIKAAYDGGFVTSMVPDLKLPNESDLKRLDFILGSIINFKEIL